MELVRENSRIINLDKINLLKRDLVMDILYSIKDYSFIDKIIIFGSSIRDDCRKDSDLDIAIKWSEECFDEDYVLKSFTLPVYEIISMKTKGNNDVIPIGYEGNLKEDIEKGVIVYNNETNIS
jgi:hypothetical protein